MELSRGAGGGRREEIQQGALLALLERFSFYCDEGFSG